MVDGTRHPPDDGRETGKDASGDASMMIRLTFRLAAWLKQGGPCHPYLAEGQHNARLKSDTTRDCDMRGPPGKIVAVYVCDIVPSSPLTLDFRKTVAVSQKGKGEQNNHTNQDYRCGLKMGKFVDEAELALQFARHSFSAAANWPREDGGSLYGRSLPGA